jgi:hypothetical protein
MATTDRPSSRCTYCTAECGASTPCSLAFSWRSSAIVTAQGVAPAARIMAIDSRTDVPAEITSSMISTRPCTGAPTSVPPSPWSLASLRL